MVDLWYCVSFRSTEKWFIYIWIAQLCPTVCDAMHCSPPSSSVPRILQAIPFSRGSSQPRGWTRVLLHWRQILYCLSHQARPHPSLMKWKNFSNHPLVSNYDLFYKWDIWGRSEPKQNDKENHSCQLKYLSVLACVLSIGPFSNRDSLPIHKRKPSPKSFR